MGEEELIEQQDPEYWERILAEEGMPAKLPPEGERDGVKVVHLGALESFVAENPNMRPVGYNPEEDLYLSEELPRLNLMDANQCDARIGADQLKKNPLLFPLVWRQERQIRKALK